MALQQFSHRNKGKDKGYRMLGSSLKSGKVCRTALRNLLQVRFRVRNFIN